ncbi:MAG: SufD family Fe-S cluster assembly protein, partial [Candidatus Omnitrophica bacterium]|nr:SufD family Fe-S cluster assembly protein [Candidatus Omnitrophota bacterium]
MNPRRQRVDNLDAERLYKAASIEEALNDPQTAHLTISHNKVISSRSLPGLEVAAKEIKDGVDIKIVLNEGIVIKNPVHMCFGMLKKEGTQRILLDIDIKRKAAISVLAHCIFPDAVKVQHIMNGKIKVGEEASYLYLEKHIHSETGGIEVYPKARVFLSDKARFKTEFELLKGRVGKIFIDYETTCLRESVMEMTARISGRGDDIISIKEAGLLEGKGSRGVLISRVAVRENARAEVFSKLIATASYARGHVDCKEIVQDKATASAVPIVEVKNPKAHITHEAAIGSVDSKQLQTLMSRGLSEEEAVEVIIKGL